MDDVRMDFEPLVAEAASRLITDGIDAFNIAATGSAAFYPVNFVLRSERGEIFGGLLGFVWGRWLQIRVLFVAEPIRRHGFGSRLLRAAEACAQERDCIAVTLETHSFQARPFYEKHGYDVFGTLPDYPPGHAKFFLCKKLSK